MKTLAYVSRKGGMGKTTCAYNIALGLPFVIQSDDKPGTKRSRILIVDLDRQKDMTFRFDKDYIEDSPIAETKKKSLYDFLTCPATEKELLSCVHFFRTGAVVYGSGRTAEIRELFKDNPRILEQRLAVIASYFDVCILDLPPAQDEIAFGALVAADFAFPCSNLSTQGTLGVRDAMVDLLAVKKLTGRSVYVPFVLAYSTVSKIKVLGKRFEEEIRRYTGRPMFIVRFDDDFVDSCVDQGKMIYSFPLKTVTRHFAELCVVITLYLLRLPLRRPAYAPFGSFYEPYEKDLKKQLQEREANSLKKGEQK